MKKKKKKDELVELMESQLDTYKKLVYHFEGLTDSLEEENASLRERLYSPQLSEN